MKYPFHTTTHEQRLEAIARGGTEIEINVNDFLVPTIAVNEDNNTLYSFDYVFMEETLKEFDSGVTEPKETSYYKKWREQKGHEYCRVRILNFKDLYEDIKQNGLKEPVAVDNTGQKIDGSHRASIMKHLGFSKIPAIQVPVVPNEDYIKRTIEARKLVYGKNYYYIDYGGYTNMEDIPVYRENSYDRWEVLKDLIKGRVVDVGCNEGFISLQCALRGHKTIGIEYEFADGANFNKQIFEMKHGKLPVDFIEADVTKFHMPSADTYLVLNVIYHIPKEEQADVLRRMNGTIIFQGNLRKAHEADKFRGCTVEGIEELCEMSNKQVIKVIPWRDKPILIAK